jgi:hypothetical protein
MDIHLLKAARRRDNIGSRKENSELHGMLAPRGWGNVLLDYQGLDMKANK